MDVRQRGFAIYVRGVHQTTRVDKVPANTCVQRA